MYYLLQFDRQIFAFVNLPVSDNPIHSNLPLLYWTLFISTSFHSIGVMVGFHTCGPNEALVVTGCCYPAALPNVVIGGWTFVWPGIQQVQSLPLGIMCIDLFTEQGMTKHGVAVTVKGVANIKVYSSAKETLTLATQLFLGKSEEEISSRVKDTLEALQRSTIAQLTVEELISDKEKLQTTAHEIMAEELIKLGLALVSYQVKDVKDCRLQVYCNLTSALKKSPLKNTIAFRKASEAKQSIPEGDEEKEKGEDKEEEEEEEKNHEEEKGKKTE